MADQNDIIRLLSALVKSRALARSGGGLGGGAGGGAGGWTSVSEVPRLALPFQERPALPLSSGASASSGGTGGTGAGASAASAGAGATGAGAGAVGKSGLRGLHRLLSKLLGSKAGGSAFKKLVGAGNSLKGLGSNKILTYGAPAAIPLVASYFMNLHQQYEELEGQAELGGLQMEAERVGQPTIEDEVARATLTEEKQKGQQTYQALLQQILQGGQDPEFLTAMAGPEPSSVSFRRAVE